MKLLQLLCHTRVLSQGGAGPVKILRRPDAAKAWDSPIPVPECPYRRVSSGEMPEDTAATTAPRFSMWLLAFELLHLLFFP